MIGVSSKVRLTVNIYDYDKNVMVPVNSIGTVVSIGPDSQSYPPYTVDFGSSGICNCFAAEIKLVEGNSNE